jgi:hypothetical protein
MDTKGGRFSLDIGGRVYSGRGKADIMPARATPTTGVNQDGSGYNTVTPQLATIALSFDRGVGLNWTEGEILQTVDLTFVETDTGVTHYLTKANWDGQPSLDSASGEVTGMKLASDRYKVTR